MIEADFTGKQLAKAQVARRTVTFDNCGIVYIVRIGISALRPLNAVVSSYLHSFLLPLVVPFQSVSLVVNGIVFALVRLLAWVAFGIGDSMPFLVPTKFRHRKGETTTSAYLHPGLPLYRRSTAAAAKDTDALGFRACFALMAVVCTASFADNRESVERLIGVTRNAGLGYDSFNHSTDLRSVVG